MITATVQLERAQELLGELTGAAERAMARALNRAATAGRQAAVKAIGERYAVRAGDVRERITLSTATPDRLEVAVVAKSGPLPLTYFPHSPSEPGTGGPGRPVLRAEILRGQEKDIRGAFVATIGGKPRVMIRTGGKTRTGKDAMKVVPSVPIAVMLGAPSVREVVEQRAVAVLDERLEHELDRELGRAP